MSDHEQRLASLAWYLRMMPKHIRSDDGDHSLFADMAADTVDAAAASIRELEADLDAARAERDKARREALEQAAKLIAPTNPPSDWTVYADVCATCANRIRALIEEPPC